MRKFLGFSSIALFIAVVYLANWAIEEYGFVSVGFGLTAPAGVFFAGIAFTARDLVHETLGRWWVLPAILAGAALSASLDTSLALASGTAFMVSEGADFAVYSPLRKRGWLKAVVASNIVGLVIDSALFLWIAFGSVEFIEGQVLAKSYMIIPAVILLGGGRAVLSRYSPPKLAG
tara:strand:- start:148 stop:672 length:525 start_codon:yes stop_codon:yes gene_type:complete